MVTLLLVFIYISYIGLGIPDSMIGPSWPVVMEEFNVPISYSNFITVTVSVFTIIASLLSVKLIKKLGTGKVVFLSTLFTAVSILGFSLSNRFIFLVIFSLPLGIGAGAIDACLNNFVSLNYGAKHMCFLHCFYGVGVFLSPFILSFTLKDNNWRMGYLYIFIVQAFVSLITLVSMPLWKKVENKLRKNDDEIKEETFADVKYRDIIKIRPVRVAWLVFFSTCALEFSCGQWLSSYLVIGKEFSADFSAIFVTLYYLCITLSRFISGLLSKKLSSWMQILIGEIIILIAVTLVNLQFLPNIVIALSVCLIGLGNGTIFPNLTHLTPENFGKNLTPLVIGAQQAVSNMGVLFAPFLFGILARYISVNIFPYYILFFALTLILSTFLFLTSLRSYKNKIIKNNKI